jgi:flagellar basal-body rod protein FlgB
MKLFDSTLGLHGQALSLRSERMEVLSRNIANADTPNFKAQDLDFRSALKGVQQGNEIKTTHAGHVSSFEGASPNLFYTNTVEINVEQAKYGRAAAEYQATLRFLEGDISAIRKVLRGD